MTQNLIDLFFFFSLNYQQMTMFEKKSLIITFISATESLSGPVNQSIYTFAQSVCAPHGVFDWSTHQNWTLHRSPSISLTFQISWPSSWVFFTALLLYFLYQLTTLHNSFFSAKSSGRLSVTISLLAFCASREEFCNFFLCNFN